MSQVEYGGRAPINPRNATFRPHARQKEKLRPCMLDHEQAEQNAPRHLPSRSTDTSAASTQADQDDVPCGIFRSSKTPPVCRLRRKYLQTSSDRALSCSGRKHDINLSVAFLFRFEKFLFSYLFLHTSKTLLTFADLKTFGGHLG